MTRSRLTRSTVAGAAVAAIVLAGLTTIGLAAASGAFRSGHRALNGSCKAPGLSGTIIDVRLMNMGGRGSMMGGGVGGMMRIATNRRTAPAGTVSFRAANVGNLTHELVVLPLAGGTSVGERSVGSDNRVEETGSLGEASNSCGAGSGDGIEPGGLGWMTVDLAAGDYELVCNLPGHYAAGMYTTLHIAS